MKRFVALFRKHPLLAGGFVLASLAGMLAVTLGLAVSYRLDSAAGPTIVVAALLLFAMAQLRGWLRSR